MGDRVTIGTLDELRRDGCLTGKAGTQPICVFWSEGAAYALDDRCPHMGFPLHRGSVESGLVTCHWHNARFDLSSGGTLDPWADDVRAYPVEIDDGQVTVVVEPEPDRTGHLLHRLDEGLEQGITLVMAKAVLGLLDDGVAPSDIVRAGVDFGTRYRQAGWGAGLTVLTAMANVLPHLDPADHALALVHGLAFVSRDTRGRPPRFPLLPLGGALPADTARRLVPPVHRDPIRRRRRAHPGLGRRHAGRHNGRRRSCSPRSPTTSSSTAATPSTSPTRRSRCSTTWAGNGPPTCCRRWWPRRPRPVAARSADRGGSPTTSPA